MKLGHVVTQGLVFGIARACSGELTCNGHSHSSRRFPRIEDVPRSPSSRGCRTGSIVNAPSDDKRHVVSRSVFPETNSLVSRSQGRVPALAAAWKSAGLFSFFASPCPPDKFTLVNHT